MHVSFLLSFFYLQGDFGVAGTVTSSKDERLITFYIGFPFEVRSEEMSEPEIRV